MHIYIICCYYNDIPTEGRTIFFFSQFYIFIFDWFWLQHTILLFVFLWFWLILLRCRVLVVKCSEPRRFNIFKKKIPFRHPRRGVAVTTHTTQKTCCGASVECNILHEPEHMSRHKNGIIFMRSIHK